MTTPQSALSSQSSVVVIGGGIAGLTAAALLGRAGVPAVVLDKSSAAGGRATTRNRGGFLFNLGPHALYRAGVLNQTLKALGVEVRGSVPNANGVFAIRNGALHTLPVGLASLLSTGILSLAGKYEFARIASRLPRIDTEPIQHESLASWLDANVRDRVVRGILEMLARVTTFTNDPQRQSAGAVLEQLQLSLRANVLYLDGGWQTIVDGLRTAVSASGGRVLPGCHAVALDRSDPRTARAVRLADGRVINAAAVIIAAGPEEVDELTGATFRASMPPPVRVATLDVALRSLPKPAATVAFGVDAPLYFSVHSRFARLAPAGGALIHVLTYLHPDQRADAEVERELDGVLDLMQPGWRALVESKHFLPSLSVTHAMLTAAQGGAAGRPGAALPMFDNVAIAGDWVGARGQLSDAAASSAADAVAAIVPRLNTNAEYVSAI